MRLPCLSQTSRSCLSKYCQLPRWCIHQDWWKQPENRHAYKWQTAGRVPAKRPQAIGLRLLLKLAGSDAPLMIYDVVYFVFVNS